MTIEGDISVPDVTPDVTSPEVTTPDVSSAPSSDPVVSTPASDEAPSLESVIAAALKQDQPDAKAPSEPAPADPAAAPKTEGQPDPAKPEANAEGADELPDELTDAELADLKKQPKNHKRVSQLLKQRAELRGELAKHQPDAENFRQIREYMDANGLADKDAAALFEFGAHLRSGRFEDAFRIVAPFMQVILEATGRSLPQDLREKVETGEITEDLAKTVVKDRYGRVLSDQKAAQATQQIQTQQVTQNVQAIQTAAKTWEDQARAKDVDFDLKASAMADFAKAIVAERGLPKTPQEAVQYAQAAYDKATDFLRKARPAPQPTRTIPSSGASQPRSGSSPTPSSMQEAILQGLAAGLRT